MPPVSGAGNNKMIATRPQGKHWTSYREPTLGGGFPNLESFQKLSIIERLTKGESLYHKVDTRNIFSDRNPKKPKHSYTQVDSIPKSPVLTFPSLENADYFSAEPKPVDILTERKDETDREVKIDPNGTIDHRMELLLPHLGKISKRSFVKITPFPYEKLDGQEGQSSSESEGEVEESPKKKKKKKTNESEPEADQEQEGETPPPNTPPPRSFRFKLPPIPRRPPIRRSDKEICQVFRYSLAMDELIKEDIYKNKVTQARQNSNEFTDRRGNEIKVLGPSVLTGMRISDLESVKGRYKRRKVSVTILEPITDVDTVDGTDDDHVDTLPPIVRNTKLLAKKDKKLACRKELSRKAIRFKLPKIIQPLKHQRKSASKVFGRNATGS